MPSELQHLLRVLRERDIDFNHDDIAKAFDSLQDRQPLESWIRDSLAPSCLLTREELIFLSSQGTAKERQDVGSRLISDQEFEAAVASLEASTAAIERQSLLIEAQREALQDIRTRHNPSTNVGDVRSARDERDRRARARLELDTGDLASAVESHVQSALKQSSSNVSSISSAVEKVLEKDDRLLNSLDAILPQIVRPNTLASDYDQVHELCQAFIALTAAEIRSRIDVCCPSMLGPSASDAINGANGHHDRQTQLLRAEVEELCREIDSLASMSVESQFRTPLHQALDNAMVDSEVERIAWVEYTSAVLVHLTSRIEALSARIDDTQARDRALQTVSAALKPLLAIDRQERVISKKRAPSPNTERSRVGLRPLRLVQANASEAQESVAQLLRYFDVKPANTIDATTLSRELTSVTQQKQTGMTTRDDQTERTVSTLLADTLNRSEVHLTSLDRALYAHSMRGTVLLTDGSIDDAIDGLEEQTDHLSEEMRKVDIDGTTAAVKRAQQLLIAG